MTPAGSNPARQGEVNGSLGVTWSPKDAAGFGSKRKNVPGTPQFLRLGFGVNQGLNGLGAVTRGDASGASVTQKVDRNRKRRFVRGVVGLNHQTEIEFVAS